MTEDSFSLHTYTYTRTHTCRQHKKRKGPERERERNMIGFPVYPKETREKKKEVEEDKCSLGRNYRKQKNKKAIQVLRRKEEEFPKTRGYICWDDSKFEPKNPLGRKGEGGLR
jgi:hypothetical protein